MPVRVATKMEQLSEFVLLASKPGVNFRVLCGRYDISHVTGYKWLSRYKEQGVSGLSDQSRRPHSSPCRTDKRMEDKIISIRKENPEWGAKKIYQLLKTQGTPPARSTITNILKRNGLITEDKSYKAQRWQRFEYDHPNQLWQMDFKGYFPLLNQSYCHPLTILDDHSRFNLCLKACKDERYITVKSALTEVFRKYGLPDTILADNGSPWGTAGNIPDHGLKAFSKLEKWIMRLQIRLAHGRAYHPQTQGKEERFHRTLKTELLQYESFRDFDHCQDRFNLWRDKYNQQRPHEALNFQVPVNKYTPSNRDFPEVLPEVEYSSTATIRKVTDGGLISFKGKDIRVGRAFTGDMVAVMPTNVDGIYEVFYCNQLLRKVKLI